MKYKGRSAASSLVFQVEAIPQTIETLHATKETPVEVKLKVRKRRNKKDMILTVPNYLIPNADPSKIQPLESNQTLITFNMLMEKSSPVTNGNNIGTLKRLMGATKGGGCLDPPYEEDVYSYQPKHKMKDLRKDSKSKKIEDRKSQLSETSTKKFTVFSKKRKSSEIVKIDSKIIDTLDVVRDTNTGKLSTHLIYSNKKPLPEKKSKHEHTQNSENEETLDKLKVLKNIEIQKTFLDDVTKNDDQSKNSPGLSTGEKELFNAKMHSSNEHINSFLLSTQPNRTNGSRQYSVSNTGFKESELILINTQKTNKPNKIIRNADITQQESSKIIMENICDEHNISKIDLAILKKKHGSSNDYAKRVAEKTINQKPGSVADFKDSKQKVYTDVNIKEQQESDLANYNNKDPNLVNDQGSRIWEKSKQIEDHKIKNESSSHANIFIGNEKSIATNDLDSKNVDDIVIIALKEPPINLNKTKDNQDVYSEFDFPNYKNDHQKILSKNEINADVKELKRNIKEADYTSISGKDPVSNLYDDFEAKQSEKGFISSAQHIPGMTVSHSELEENHHEAIMDTKLEDRFSNQGNSMKTNIDNRMNIPSFIESDNDDTKTKSEIGDQQSPLTITDKQLQDALLTDSKKTEISGAKSVKDQRDNLTQGYEINTIFSERTLVESVQEEHLSDETLDDTNTSIKIDLTEDIRTQDISMVTNKTLDSTTLIAPYLKRSDASSVETSKQIKESSMIDIQSNDSKNILDILEPTILNSSSNENLSAGLKSQSLLTDANEVRNMENEQSRKFEDSKLNLNENESLKYKPLSNNEWQSAAEENYANNDNTSDQHISLLSDTFSPLNVDLKLSQQITTAIPDNLNDDFTADDKSVFNSEHVSALLLAATNDNFEAKKEIGIKNYGNSSSKHKDQDLKISEYNFDESDKTEITTGITIDAKFNSDLRNFGNDANDTNQETANIFVPQINDTRGQAFDIIKYSSNISDIEQSSLPFPEQDLTKNTDGDERLDMHHQQIVGEIKKESKNFVDMVCYLAESMYESINKTQNDGLQKQADKFKENINLVDSNKDLDIGHGDVNQNYPQTSYRESIGVFTAPETFDQSEQTTLIIQGATGTIIETLGNDMKAVRMEKNYPLKVYKESSIVTNIRQSDVSKTFPLKPCQIDANAQLKISVSKSKCSTTVVPNNNKIKHIQTTFNDKYDTSNVEIVNIIFIYEEIVLIKTAITELKLQIKMLEDRLLLLRQTIIGWKSKSKLVRVPNTRCICVRQRSSKKCFKQ